MTLRLASYALVLLACATPSARPAPGATPPRRIVLVTAWSACSDQHEDLDLKVILESEMERISTRLHALASDAEVLRFRNIRWSVLKPFLREDARPLWFVYFGHGKRDGDVSVLCLPDGKVAQAEVVASPPATQRYATYLFNTCMSSFVLLPRDNAVVISSGPDSTDNEHLETVVGRDLQTALDGVLDGDGDGLVDSSELFTALDRAHISEHPVQLKLHAQSWTPLPLFSLGGHSEPDLAADSHALAVDAPSAFWSIPPELDGLQERRGSIRRIELRSATTAAKHSQATRYFQVARANGNLVVRDLGLGQVIWRRPPYSDATTPFADDDHEDFFRGYEPFENGKLRWYLRPISSAQRAELERLAFRPTSCSEKYGQCFRRAGTQGERR